MRGALVAFAVLAGCASFASSSEETPDPTNDGGADANADANAVPDGGSSDAGKDAETGPGAGEIVVAAVSRPAFIAADDAMVVYGSEDGAILRADVDGKNNGTISTYGGNPRQIFIEGVEVIWGDHTVSKQGIWRLKGGNTVRTAEALSVTGLARFGGGFATFDNANGALVAVDDSGSNVSPIGQYVALYDLVADGDDIVWTVSGSALVMRKTGSSSPTPIATNESDARAIARNGDGVYWTLGTTTVRKLDRATNVRSDLALGQQNVHGLIADDTGVYWLTNDSLRRFSKTTGTIETLATGFQTPDADVNLARIRKIALTPSFVFWLTAKDLRRIAK